MHKTSKKFNYACAVYIALESCKCNYANYMINQANNNSGTCGHVAVLSIYQVGDVKVNDRGSKLAEEGGIGECKGVEFISPRVNLEHVAINGCQINRNFGEGFVEVLRFLWVTLYITTRHETRVLFYHQPRTHTAT